MSRSAQSIQRSAYMILGMVFVLGGGTFCYYLWTGTEIHTDGRRMESGTGGGNTLRLAPALSLKVEERTPGGICIVATVTNTSNARMTIPDVMSIEPLYIVSLKYAATKNDELHDLARIPLLNRTTISEPNPPVPYNPVRDVEVDLNPGRSHSVAIPLGQFYVTKPGHYEARVAFRPTELFGEGEFKILPPFNVSSAGATLTFDLPIPAEKPVVLSPASSSVNNPDSAVKTVELPTANK